MTGPLVAARDPFIGQSLAGRYRVDRKIGEGGMGAVYRGEHLLIQRPVAIKILHPQLATSGDLVRRFLNEARAVTAIRHENIVDVTDMGQLDDGTLFMVLELLEGHDFASLIEAQGALPIGRVIHIVDQMCAALEAAHERGIIHRDLKPENVFLVSRAGDPDFVKILDFGIAKILGGDGSGVRTQTGLAMGTLHYMSPEQVQGGRDLDCRADIYALGVILFRALGGSFPYDSDTLASLLAKILLDPIPPLRSVRADAPAELEAVVSRCLAKRAADRFATCAQLRAALRAIPTRAPAPSLALAPTMLPPPAQKEPALRASMPSAAELARPSMPPEVPMRLGVSAPLLAGLAVAAVAGLTVAIVAGVTMMSDPPPPAASPAPLEHPGEPSAPEPIASTLEPIPEAPLPEGIVEPPPALVEAPEAPARRPPPRREPLPSRGPEPLAQPLAPPPPLAPSSPPAPSGLGSLGQGTVRRIP